MPAPSVLDGLKLLVVDDEQDILETLIDLLYMCEVDTAQDYETAAEMLSSGKYDVAIIDIMGVHGFDLLIIANKKEIPSLVLTSHGLTPENLVKSIKGGAYTYLPKEKMIEMEGFIVDLINARKNWQKHKHAWLKKLGPYFNTKFGNGWKEKDRDFWDKFENTMEQSDTL